MLAQAEPEIDDAGMILTPPFKGLPYRDTGVLYADPATKFKTRSEAGQGRSAEQHYDTMDYRKIMDMPVRWLCRQDCFLFLWVTNPMPPRLVEDLIEAWGFTYSGVFCTWVKTNPKGPGWHFGLGYGSRQNTERVILGRRGSPRRCAKNVPELLFWPRMEHSRKPPIVKGRIERFAGRVPRIELFSREDRPGWLAWGDEAGKFNGVV